MEQSSCWEANKHLAGQNILRPLWNPKIQCCVYRILPPVRILSTMSPVHTHLISIKSILILSPIYAEVFHVVFSIQFYD